MYFDQSRIYRKSLFVCKCANIAKEQKAIRFTITKLITEHSVGDVTMEGDCNAVAKVHFDRETIMNNGKNTSIKLLHERKLGLTDVWHGRNANGQQFT